ncbi:MAG: glycoside hydrolase family 125 protein [Meiothermus sp.]|nr:glycoside hydrolase family 125 protein [Meiothermus sp.]
MELMTPAPILDTPPEHLPTGNLEVHVEASPKAPSITRMGVASLALNGLLDWVGEPLLEVSGRGWKVSRTADWIPVWENDHLTVTLLAPYGERGLALRLEPRTSGPIQVAGNLEYLGLRRFREERLEATFRTTHDGWTGSYGLEARSERTLLALGWQADPPPTRVDWGQQFVLEWDTGPVTLFISLAPESDGARTTALHLRRVGWEHLLRKTLHKLALLTTNYSGPLYEVYRRHLIFSYFYAQADTLEGEPVLLTSRSPHYYVSGAYWARDGLLWFFPALLKADRKRAKAVLKSVFRRFARWPGEHAQYLSGPPLYPGFELDQAAAYPLALARYLELSGPNPELLSELREPLEWVFERVAEEKHPSLPLYRTFLSPTDDPVPEPYLTYDNALWAVALERLSPYWREPETLKHEARALREPLSRQAERNGRFVFRFEPGGHYIFSDEPAGSLLLLPHLGFCNRQDPIWQATALWILGDDNPHHYKGRFPGEGSAHFPFPSGFGLANRILSGLMRPAGDALMTLEQAPLDQGYASESFDPQTGVSRTGVGFAALAGFVAYALSAGKEGRTASLT